MNSLPREDVTTEDWSSALGLVQALTTRDEPVVVGIRDDRVQSSYLSLRGWLRGPRRYRPLQSHPYAQLFDIDWPKPGDACGHVALYEHLFERCSLNVDDGDTYFWLYLYFGSLTVAFEDINRD
jgi:hypothetical protein